ncbi:MAG: hypothetical protein BWY43_00578 [candidate division WS2 bacterium ADurb.Bin280]|uniref:N-acetyltransferase domain-containing protein n=1 Tax=candidate division WS2 bacterium ADurb.Bin280 TaxID=1852829 RepID=A0A1V5SCQ2_9BACT|nr:MAG: hypothetical protein BWY43_00578 [candidate division WS2 bacterium ADurb.Bin280]
MIVRNRMDRADISEQAQKEFDEALQNPDSMFYILKLDGNLIGFFRVDSMSESDAYLGSLNVPPEVQGAGIGDEILRRFFIHALNGRVGHATADPRNRVTPKYIGRYNFVGSGIKPFGDSGRNFIEMTLNPQINNSLKLFSLRDEQIAQMHQGNSYDLSGDSQIILRFPSAKLEAIMEEAQTILANNRFVMSAFRRRIEDQQEIIYMGFELNPLTRDNG